MLRRPSSRRALPLALLAAHLACGTALGCGCDERKPDRQEVQHEYRKALLAAEDRERQRAEKREQARVQDDSGGLIPSDERVAGILMPRGLTLRIGFEREWYYETTLPADAVRAYFGPRLNTPAVVPGGGDTVTYQNAIPRDTPGAEPVTVRIGPLPNQRGKTEINIRLQVRAKPPASEAEARLMAEERARFAD